MSKFVYLSGPITGTTYQEARYGWRKDFAKLLHFDIIPLSPMRHEGHLSEIQGPLEKEYPEALFSHPKMIVAKDLLDIEMANLFVANLKEASRVSIGTMVELGYAKKAGKTIITIMDKGTIHDHPFVRELSDTVVKNLEDAAIIVNSLLSEGI